jgi:monofunctional glycosyltransferase
MRMKKFQIYALSLRAQFGNHQNATQVGVYAFLRKLVRWLVVSWTVLFVYNSFFPAVSTLMLGRWLSFQEVQRDWVPIERISAQVYRAIIAAEDGKFCHHHGVDWESMSAEMHKVMRRLQGKRTDDIRGASTISMQTVKNLMLWNGRSYVRKALELPLALGVDAVWSKQHMMERYLNIAEFGDGVFGIEAAAEHYFNKSAATLNLREAALLAATLPNPTERNPAKPSHYVHDYAQDIARRVARGVDSSCVR